MICSQAEIIDCMDSQMKVKQHMVQQFILEVFIITEIKKIIIISTYNIFNTCKFSLGILKANPLKVGAYLDLFMNVINYTNIN